MSVRTRTHLAALISAAIAYAMTRVADAAEWTKLETYVGAVAVVVVFGLIAMFWIEMAPDGAFRRRPPA